MIQPSWDNLAESTQRTVNGPSLSQQLQEAYEAGYNRALNEQDQGGWVPYGGGYVPGPWDGRLINPLDWDRHGNDPLHPQYDENQRTLSNQRHGLWIDMLRDGFISQEQFDREYPDG